MKKSPLALLTLEALERHGLNQADLARLIPVSEATVSRWISGSRNPGRKNAARLRELLAQFNPDISIDGGEGWTGEGLDIVRSLRLNLTLTDIAQYVGKSVRTVLAWSRGDLLPSAESLAALRQLAAKLENEKPAPRRFRLEEIRE